jgi:hypothetical protein
MFQYCISPEVEDAREREKKIRQRAPLHRYLIIAVATLARPDAAHDVSTLPERRQWNSQARVLALNPNRRRQTKKYRATVPIAHPVAKLLDAASPGYFVGPKSVSTSWSGMAAALCLPGDGEAGLKLIRRSMADLLRTRLPEEAWGEIGIFMGHSRFNAITSLYAPLKPSYLGRALAGIEAIIEEIEALAPGAFHRDLAGEDMTSAAQLAA